MIAYWFSDKNGRTRNFRNEMPSAKIGLIHKVSGDLVMCRNGLHSSPTPWDALFYAEGDQLWRVEIGDEYLKDGDKFCARSRTYIAVADFEKTLRRFAKDCALSVVHLWNPSEIVLQYLTSDNEELRAAACDSALDSARAGARAAASNAACDSARAAASNSALDSAWAAACDSALAAALDSALDSAWDAASNAAWDAAILKFNEMAFKALEELK